MIASCLIATAHAGSVTNFDDIQFWSGTGANQAALAIDWDGPGASDNSLVWGFRWDGTAKGLDMLTAVVMADDRLYAKIGPISGYGIGVVGLGYDANNDGEFALSDGTVFDEYGINDEVPSDFAVTVDPEDWYAEGWLFSDSFWNYGIATAGPFDGGMWGRAGGGVSNRTLADGSWDSLAYSPIDTLHYAQNPLAAEPAGNADFDGDGDVDGRDFLVWQRGESPNPLSASDLAAWQANYRSSSFFALRLSSSAISIPEPSTALSVGLFLVLLTRFTRHN